MLQLFIIHFASAHKNKAQFKSKPRVGHVLYKSLWVVLAQMTSKIEKLHGRQFISPYVN